MSESKSIERRVRQQITTFLEKSDGHRVNISGTTDLISDAGLTSLQGMEFVLDLCEEFNFDFPADFNPFVDDSRRRGQTLDGLVKAIEGHLAGEGEPNVKKG